MGYPTIQDHGVIGNMHTAALVSSEGIIDWLCLPDFDSPSVFAAILDDKRGGSFAISPVNSEGLIRKQMYWPDTNVLITRFLHADGVVEIVDYMPVGMKSGETGCRHLVRRVDVVRGNANLIADCTPALNYGRDTHKVEISEHGAIFRGSTVTLELATSVKLSAGAKGGVRGHIQLKQGESASFILRLVDAKGSGPRVSARTERHLFDQTIRFWHQWLSQCTYSGRWRETVQRSALLLKLLTFEPTGAIIAAPTCSLPEAIPGSRNWDYRYTWIRDAAFSLYALMRIGFDQEAAAFMKWLEQRCHEREPDGGLQVMYGIRGEHDLPEQTLDHLDGYKDCRPVRIGNAASKQLQLDIYGELLDSIYLFNKYGEPISWDLWVQVRGLVDWVCDHWREPDDGIWEIRGGRQQFVYSKLMCWVAIDRACALPRRGPSPPTGRNGKKFATTSTRSF